MSEKWIQKAISKPGALTDAPVTGTAWATYRQALRDVPNQAGFPWDVQWPNQPTG